MTLIHELTDQSFDSFLQSEKLVIVEFYAKWCSPCKPLALILDEIAQDHQEYVIVGKIDADENPMLTQKYGVMSLPTVISFQTEQVSSHFVGYRSKDNILSLLNLPIR